MRPLASRLPVPSSGLLRFLQQQSERLFAAENSSILLREAGLSLPQWCQEQDVGSRTEGWGKRHVPVAGARARRGSRCIRDTLSTNTVALTTRPRWPVACLAAGPQAPSTASHALCFSTSRPARSWGSRGRPDEKQQRRRQKVLQELYAWQKRLWGRAHWGWGSGSGSGSGSSRLTSMLQPGDLPDHGAGAEFASVMFNARRLQTAKAALEPRLRCTEVDENGEVILVDGEFKKTELIAKYGLLPRDLRKIDSSNLPHILVRPAAILLNLLHLKVLIKADRVLLFDVYGSKTSYPQSAFLYDLQERLQQKPVQTTQGGGGGGGGGGQGQIGGGQTAGEATKDEATSQAAGRVTTGGHGGQRTAGHGHRQTPTSVAPGLGGLPYEFRALEAVLLSVTSELEAEFDTVREPVIRILSELEEDITRDKLRLLLVLSKKVNTFEQKAKLVRDAIEELLEADDDLAAMYLTEKKHDLYRGEDDHTEVEMLLESYHKICDEVAQEAGSLVLSIRNTEEIIRAILDANRNALMLLDLKFSIGTLGLAMGTFLAGLYGMNLENFIEETNWGFGSVTTLSFAFSLLVCWYGLVKLRKVQRVKMHGSSTGGGFGFVSGGDYGVLPPGFGYGLGNAPLDSRSRERLRRLGMRGALMQKKYY